jgi:site-specific DNA-cytosine methylase
MSVMQALKDYTDIQVISIGISDKMGKYPNTFHCDLSAIDCCEKLKQLPKPDIILASPPCES